MRWFIDIIMQVFKMNKEYITEEILSQGVMKFDGAIIKKEYVDYERASVLTGRGKYWDYLPDGNIVITGGVWRITNIQLVHPTSVLDTRIDFVVTRETIKYNFSILAEGVKNYSVYFN